MMQHKAIPIILIACIWALGACSGQPGAGLGQVTGTPAPTARPTYTRVSDQAYFQPPEWARGAVIYQLFVRAFTPEGTLAAAAKRLPELKDLGVEVILLLPIHPTGLEHRTGSLGSPYSIRDFRAIDPALGSEADFRQFVQEAHRLGLHVLMDWVANHTAWDNPLASEHPDWYTRDGSGKILPPLPEWPDVADLNYDSPGLRDYMIETSLYWVETFGIDGYRCDTSFLVPADFWEAWRKALKETNPDLLLLSESDGLEMYQAGFEAAYDWTTPNKFFLALKAPAVAGDLLRYMLVEQGPLENQIWRVRYLENHDHDRLASLVYGLEKGKLAAAFLLTLPGMPMIYAGQEIGATLRPSLFDRDTVRWADGNEELRAAYTELIRLRKESPALRGGGLEAIETGQPTVFAYTRSAPGQRVVVVLHMAADPVTVTLAGIPAGKDLRTGARVDPGAGFELEGYGFRLIEMP